MQEFQLIRHTIAPIYAADSKVLLLGTMPSPKSREAAFYYGHPQNRFWRTLAAVFDEPLPQDIAEKTALLLRHRLALWDVLESCLIKGADDSSIREPRANDLPALIAKTQITAVFCTGAKAHLLYQQLCQPSTGIPAVRLPSTSPANRRFSDSALLAAYSQIRATLNQA